MVPIYQSPNEPLASAARSAAAALSILSLLRGAPAARAEATMPARPRRVIDGPTRPGGDPAAPMPGRSILVHFERQRRRGRAAEPGAAEFADRLNLIRGA